MKNEQEIWIGSSIKAKKMQIDNKYMERYFRSLATRDLQIKTMV